MLAAHAATVGQAPTIVELDAQGLPQKATSYEFVQARLDLIPHYPGAQLFSSIGSPEVINFQGYVTDNAWAGGIFSTSDSPDAVRTYYRTWAGANGWRPRDIARMSTESVADGFERPQREIFTLGIDDPRMLADVLGKEVPSAATIFEVSYTIISSRNTGRYIQP